MFIFLNFCFFFVKRRYRAQFIVRKAGFARAIDNTTLHQTTNFSFISYLYSSFFSRWHCSLKMQWNKIKRKRGNFRMRLMSSSYDSKGKERNYYYYCFFIYRVSLCAFVSLCWLVNKWFHSEFRIKLLVHYVWYTIIIYIYIYIYIYNLWW